MMAETMRTNIDVCNGRIAIYISMAIAIEIWW